MAYNNNQRNQGGLGGIKGSASANPSGMKALPNDNFIEGEFSRVGNSIGPVKNKVPSMLGKVVSKVAAPIAGGMMFKDAVSGFGSEPGDQRSPAGFQAPAIGKFAAQSLPTDPKAENARYIIESKQRLANKSIANNVANIASNNSVNKPVDNPAVFTNKPTGEVFGPPSSFIAKNGDVNTTTNLSNGSLKIDLGGNRGGTIRFNDGRTISPSKLTDLNNRIAFNNSKEGLDSFARNAQLTAQREAEGRSGGGNDPLGQLGQLVNQARYDYANAGSVTQKAISGHRLRNLEDLAMKADELGATTGVANSRTNLDARKYLGESAFKGQQEANKRNLANYQLVVDQRKAGILDPSQAAAYLTSDGSLLDYNKLGAVFDQNQLKEFNDAEDDDARANMLAEYGIKDPRHIKNVINSFNQYQKLGQ